MNDLLNRSSKDFGNWNKERKNVERQNKTNIYKK